MLDRIVYTDHGEEKRRAVGVSAPEVRAVLANGTVLRRYPEDRPFPSYLVLGWIDGRPVHVVAADDEDREVTWIITIYEPDPDKWTEGFKWKPEWKSTENTWKSEN
jgi:hypothetical protein